MSGCLTVNNVGKAYRRWGSEWTRVASWFGLRTKAIEEHWVLRRLSFSVDSGEAVGVVGQNGAGKSTLLKIIAGTIQPTEGRVSRTGSIAAILELGMGFSSELTGRENARYAAGLMGIPTDKIESLMPSIEDFAEIGEYFDHPIRTYSSGMQMRVAFSVATCIRPDLFIVDEALSVGDAYFVHKSFRRIAEFREAGTSLLVVSHDAAAITALCDRAILLDEGRLVVDGRPSDVLDYYNAMIAEKENSGIQTKEREGVIVTESGTREATFGAIQLRDASGASVEYIGVGDQVTLTASVCIHAPIPRLVIGYMIRDRLGQPIYGTNTHHTEQMLEGLDVGETVEFAATFNADLGPGSYSISIALSSTETHLVNNYEWKDLALVFTVANLAHPRFVGCAYIQPKIAIRST